MSKISWKDIFTGFQYTVFSITLLLYKKAVLHSNVQFYVIYLLLTKEITQTRHLWQELLKSTSKI